MNSENDMTTRPGKHINEDACTDILHGLLSRDEVTPLLDHVATCDSCEQLFRQRAADFELLRVRTATMELPSPSISLGSRLWENVRARMEIFSPRLVTTSLSASVAVLLLIIVIVSREPSPEVTVPSYWIPERADMLELRSAEKATGRDLLAGMRAYQAHNFELAAELLSGAQLDTPYVELRNVYLSSALASLERYDEALVVLGSMQALDLPQPWRDEFEWIRCISLFGAGRHVEAISLLESLRSIDGPIGLEARRWEPDKQ